MLQYRLRIILLIALLAVFILIIRQIRKKKLDVKYTVLWFGLILVLALLAIFPQILDLTSKALGIYSPINMLFFFGFVFSLMIIFSLSVAISRMADEIKRLTQELALLEKKIKDEEVNKYEHKKLD